MRKVAITAVLCTIFLLASTMAVSATVIDTIDLLNGKPVTYGDIEGKRDGDFFLSKKLNAVPMSNQGATSANFVITMNIHDWSESWDSDGWDMDTLYLAYFEGNKRPDVFDDWDTATNVVTFNEWGSGTSAEGTFTLNYTFNLPSDKFWVAAWADTTNWLNMEWWTLTSAKLELLSTDDGLSQGGNSGGSNPVPEPASMFLLGSGLFGFAVKSRKYVKK